MDTLGGTSMGSGYGGAALLLQDSACATGIVVAETGVAATLETEVDIRCEVGEWGVFGLCMETAFSGGVRGPLCRRCDWGAVSFDRLTLFTASSITATT